MNTNKMSTGEIQTIIGAIEAAQDAWDGADSPIGPLELDGVDSEKYREAARAARERKTLVEAIEAAEEVLGCRIIPPQREGIDDSPDIEWMAEKDGITTVEGLAEALDATAAEIEEVEGYAQAAAGCGDEAIEALRRGDLGAARAALEQACEYESEFGGSSTWDKPLDLLRELMEEGD